MNQSDIGLLDLSNEILLIILKKLDNIDVLYSLFGINNQRLEILLQDDVFANTLNLATTSSITDLKLERFCTYILPRSNHCIKKLILETTSMERILLAGNYPNLTALELINFEQKKVFHYFTGKHLTCSKGELHNLKCFSLTSYDLIMNYDDLVVPLFRRMTHLEKLTLYFRILHRNAFVDGTHLQNEILAHMPQLHTFTFYISTQEVIFSSFPRKSNSDIERTFTNIRYGQTACIIDSFNGDHKAICHVYSLPFTFTRLETITTHFPFIVFDTVTILSAYDMIPMQHEFFMRISQAFPMLKYFSMKNERSQSLKCDEWKSDKNSSYSIIEYPHLMSLDVMYADIDYIAQFLLETKTHLPRLTQLKVDYYQLKTVTMNFTRDTIRRNCSKINRLIVKVPTVFSKDVYQYFPSL
ncbi:unnamed protein product [Rotaria sordida]|uniref:F-box domain-containing protein n=1 Tax=Rotaria sordida TaxID=392033 RepID=A0A815P373_9BILA|nr:unnamed protein product [Rotaria sordida]CAF1443568.1 unnamed protein product [Rotaria sordida]CAF3982994.1 unnamed protein product [Rotaria sordida]